MKTVKCAVGAFRSVLWPVVPLFAVLSVSAHVLDNFDDNTKTGWSDYPAVNQPALIPQETGGQFKLDVPPAMVGESQGGLFTASVKTTEEYTIREGRTVEFRVDLVQGAGNDAYAVLAFAPKTIDPKQTIGYSLAKSANEIILVKALDHYFLDDDSAAATVKHNNVTLVLSLTGKNGNVVITGKVLDKDNQDAVLWERTAVDTQGADFGNEGDLLTFQKPFIEPIAPTLGKGNFALYLYAIKRDPIEGSYQAIFDNAETYVMDTTVLDDFRDNTKTGWTDYPAIDHPSLIPQEQNGQFKMDVPAALVSASQGGLFTASVKTTKEYTIREGDKIEFSVDLVQGAGNDAYAVLAFAPKTIDPKQTIGYSLAKSANEIILVKALDHYFLDDDTPTATVKHANVTLALALVGKNGNVVITGRVLDKDNQDAVLWERTAVDTPNADFSNEADLLTFQKPFIEPIAPTLGKGNFALYLYAIKRAPLEDTYQAIFANALVSAPTETANQPPVISDVIPANYASFLPASTSISFTATDDKDLADDKLAITLNDTNYTKSNGLVVTGTGTNRTVSLPGKLLANTDYLATFSVTDSDGLVATKTLYFDTFAVGNVVVEVEDYNFNGGEFFNNPTPIVEGGGPQNGSYGNQTGTPAVDFSDTRTSPDGVNTLYRVNDPIRMQHSLDVVRKKFQDAGGSTAGVYDYDVGDIAADEWLNYTRDFPSGSYIVYLRESLLNMGSGESVLELVAGDPTQPNQTTSVLGSFLGTSTGFNYRNFALTDGTGQNKVVLRLSGKTTLRLRQVTANPSGGSRFENYLVFVPTADSGIQRATVNSVAPLPGSVSLTAFPVIQATILNRDTSVKTSTISLTLNGQSVAATVTGTTNGATLTCLVSPLPSSDATNIAQVAFKDSDNVDVSTEWSFVISYATLDPATRAGSGKDRGFKVRVVQAPKDIPNLENSLTQAENQLANVLAAVFDSNVVSQVINYSRNAPWSDPSSHDGYFGDDLPIPGLAESGDGTADDLAMEVLTFLDLPAGAYRFGVVSDDGYAVMSGTPPLTRNSPTLSSKPSGTADTTFDVAVTAAGVYPFRFVWFQHQGGAHVEWFTVNAATGERTLINDPNAATAVKAYTAVKPPESQLHSATVVAGPYTQDSSATIDTVAKTIQLPVPAATRFYQVNWGGGLGLKIHILSIRVEGPNLKIHYEELPAVP